MWLSDLSLPLPYADCKDLALVYPYEVAVTLYGVQEEHGDPRHVPAGRQLSDGRWMLCGDVLSEVGEGGILAQAFAYMTPEIMAQVEVLPMSEVAGLVPKEEAEPPAS
jgi:hypothetical protein